MMEINLGKLPFDLDFHPSEPLVATALINGDLHLYRYATDSQPQRLLEIRAHDESCRAVRFIDSGRAILTASPDCSILATDVETGTTIARLEDAHEAAVNRLISLTDTTVSSGDDEGCIKVWDTRQRSCCNSFSAHEDYISDMTFVSNSMQLLGTSGDGTLSVCSLRKNKVQTRSEFSEDELLSIVTMKNGRKVICGTQTGTLLLYSWGYFKDCRFAVLNFVVLENDIMWRSSTFHSMAGWFLNVHVNRFTHIPGQYSISDIVPDFFCYTQPQFHVLLALKLCR